MDRLMIVFKTPDGRAAMFNENAVLRIQFDTREMAAAALVDLGSAMANDGMWMTKEYLIKGADILYVKRY